jgi:hypothetical protein
MGSLYFAISYSVWLDTKDPTWLNNNSKNIDFTKLLLTNWWTCYVWLLYWSVTTMVSGGYGE